MCESKVYVLENEEKKLVMEESAKVVFGDKITVYGILGNLVEVEDCEIDYIDLMKHEIILKKK